MTTSYVRQEYKEDSPIERRNPSSGNELFVDGKQKGQAKKAGIWSFLDGNSVHPGFNINPH